MAQRRSHVSQLRPGAAKINNKWILLKYGSVAVENSIAIPQKKINSRVAKEVPGD